MLCREEPTCTLPETLFRTVFVIVAGRCWDKLFVTDFAHLCLSHREIVYLIVMREHRRNRLEPTLATGRAVGVGWFHLFELLLAKFTLTLSRTNRLVRDVTTDLTEWHQFFTAHLREQ